MKTFISYLCFSFFIVGGTSLGKEVPCFTSDDFRVVSKTSSGLELQAQGILNVHEQIRIPATIEVTARGNGLLRAANIACRVYDGDDNTEVYVGELLNLYLVDLDGDGWKELIACGVKELHSEKGNVITAYRPELMIWRFNPKRGEFDPPFGIFDPYSVVRNYYEELPLPTNRIVLPEPYRENLLERTDSIRIKPYGFSRELHVVYGLRRDQAGAMKIHAKLDIPGAFVHLWERPFR